MDQAEIPQKRTRTQFSYPIEAEAMIKDRCKTLGMSEQQYLESLVCYDCWIEKPHHLTGPSIRGTREEADRVWKEVIADYGKPDKSGSYFEHRVEEKVQEELEKALRAKVEEIVCDLAGFLQKQRKAQL